MNGNENVEKVYKYLGSDGDKYCFKLRTLIMDMVAGIENKEHLSDILRYATSVSCKESFIDHKWVVPKEYKIKSEAELEEIEEKRKTL